VSGGGVPEIKGNFSPNGGKKKISQEGEKERRHRGIRGDEARIQKFASVEGGEKQNGYFVFALEQEKKTGKNGGGKNGRHMPTTGANRKEYSSGEKKNGHNGPPKKGRLPYPPSRKGGGGGWGQIK